MVKQLKRVDISNIPELVRIAQEVRDSREPKLLQRDNEELAILMPMPPSVKRRPKGRPTTANDPLWDIVGMAHSAGPGDVSENVDRYLAEAYLHNNG